MCTGDIRIVPEHTGFHSYEGLGTSSANLTKYLLQVGQLELPVTATRLGSKLPLLLSTCRLWRQQDTYFYFPPVEIAELLFSSLKKLEFTPAIHEAL